MLSGYLRYQKLDIEKYGLGMLNSHRCNGCKGILKNQLHKYIHGTINSHGQNLFSQATYSNGTFSIPPTIPTCLSIV